VHRQKASRRRHRGLISLLLVAAIPMSTTWGQQPAAARRLPGGIQRLPGVSLSPPISSPARAPAPTTVQRLFESFDVSTVTTPTQGVSASVPSRIHNIQSRRGDASAQRWLRTSTSSASREVARRLIDQASAEYSIGAWASAETSAWEGLRFAAESVELASRERGDSPANGRYAAALANLQIARTAIREARDFGGHYGVSDRASIRRMATSHQTAVLDSQPIDTLTAADAIDRYLDEARVRLSDIASQSVEAAQAMDLLAAIYLGRADVKTLPSSTALCLRRAALQGQPENASLALRLGMHLADLGLYREARWALEHSLKLDPSQEASEALVLVLRRSGRSDEAARLIASMQTTIPDDTTRQPRVPQVDTLSPQEFASISKPVMKASQRTSVVSGTLASARRNLVRVVRGHPDEAATESDTAEQAPSEVGQPSMIRRFFNSLIHVW
jgi:tetratricopeptide (TPR) repeat protein